MVTPHVQAATVAARASALLGTHEQCLSNMLPMNAHVATLSASAGGLLISCDTPPALETYFLAASRVRSFSLRGAV